MSGFILWDAKCFGGRERGRCARACSNEVFPREMVGVLRSRLPATAKCFLGRGSGRCVDAGNSEVFPKERVGALRSHLQHSIFEGGRQPVVGIGFPVYSARKAN